MIIPIKKISLNSVCKIGFILYEPRCVNTHIQTKLKKKEKKTSNGCISIMFPFLFQYVIFLVEHTACVFLVLFRWYCYLVYDLSYQRALSLWWGGPLNNNDAKGWLTYYIVFQKSNAILAMFIWIMWPCNHYSFTVMAVVNLVSFVHQGVCTYHTEVGPPLLLYECPQHNDVSGNMRVSPM